jgi:hypothetical protein
MNPNAHPFQLGNRCKDVDGVPAQSVQFGMDKGSRTVIRPHSALATPDILVLPPTNDSTPDILVLPPTNDSTDVI